MVRLGASVGTGGVNNHDDVLVVQRLLNRNSHIADTIGRVPEDGNVDDRTRGAIIAFQRSVVGLAQPDGRVDPGGRTFRVLTGDSPHGATSAFVQLPANGDGYYTYSSRDRQWGTPRTIESVTAVAASLARAGIEIGIGHLSFANGARMPPHDSHRRGIDVDIRPQRTDGAREPVNISLAVYDREKTRRVVAALRRDENLALIFFNDRRIEGVRSWDGHDNHLHVRFRE